ncbi:condensation domain-containing protein, partial [Nocardia salmonicida]|uniref:condensation domain-containing protein n=1 Tax=Nocardia salmonicida TaxID=53431 RepID=UPI00378F62B1
MPEFMVPALVMVVDELPLTVNGKLDRRALPAPDFVSGVEYREPSSPVEKALADVFAEILGVDRVGVDDSFFDLGGNSILATRLVSRAQSLSGVTVSIQGVFETPTVSGLARRLGEEARPRPALSRRDRPDVIPLSFAQRRLWFLHRLEGPSATYNMPMVLRLAGTLDANTFEEAIRDVLDRHEPLRTVFPVVDGSPRQEIVSVAEADFGLEVVDSSDWSTDRLDAAIRSVARYGFDLAREIPLRVRLFRRGDDESVLILLMHHIAGDGWSWRPLMADLGHAYTARMQGQAPQWQPLPVQYVDYTFWQRDLLGSSDDPDSLLSRQLSYWRDELAGLPARTELPTD